MAALVSQSQPFVPVLLDSVESEAHEDQKLRMLWLKRNKKALAAVCRGIVAIEPDQAKRLVSGRRARHWS